MSQIKEMKRNIRNYMMGNFHYSTDRIPRGLPRGYSFKYQLNSTTTISITLVRVLPVMIWPPAF